MPTTPTLAERTGQTERLRRRETLQLCGMAIWFGAQLSGYQPLSLVGLGLFFFAFALASRAVRCPQCGFNLSGHAVIRVPIGQSTGWAERAEKCPRCGYGGEEPDAEPSIPARLVERPSPSQPWRLPKPTVDAPEGWDWGLHDGREMHRAGPDELRRRVARGPAPLLVWTPEQRRLVWPEEVPELLDAIRAEGRERARAGVLPPLALAASIAAGMALGDAPVRLGGGATFWLAAALIWTGYALCRLHRAPRMDAAEVRARVEQAQHEAWVRTVPTPWTRMLAVAVAAVGLSQVLSSGRTLPAVGLLASKALGGEWWRLLTYGVVHAHVLHFALNFLALLSLGRIAEVHAHRAFLPLLTLAGVLGGGAASLLFPVGVPVVGISGGLLAVIGFAVVMGYRRRAVLPTGFGAEMVRDVALVAAVGLAGFRTIANAGHLGGLVAGLLLGMLLVPRPGAAERVGWDPGPVARFAGTLSLAVLLGTAVAAALHLVALPAP